MVYNCVVYGCFKRSEVGVRTLHEFPRDCATNNAWKRFVRRTRADWSTPTKSSRVCSDHFSADCFENLMAWRFKHVSHLMLKPFAVPTIYPCSASSSLTSQSTPKRPRSAVRKREVLRIISSYDESQENLCPQPTPVTPQMSDASTQYEIQPGMPGTRSVKCQAKFLRNRRPPHRSQGNQTEDLKTASTGVSCRLLKPESTLQSTGSQSIDDTESEPESDEDEEMDVSLYEPDEDEELDDCNFTSACHVDEEKFIVFKSCLWELFATCPKCNQPCLVEEKYRKGTKVCIHQQCPSCDFTRDWSSQPSYHGHGDIPAGNLQLSGAILFTGASPSKTLRVLNAMNVVTTSLATFNNHMSKFLVPTVLHTWQEEQKRLFQILSEMEGGLVIGGDGRSDSPGHSAKYGSYTVLEERVNKIIDLQLVQSNEPGVKNSNAMEKEGLVRAVSVLKDAQLAIETIVTDRHPQIQKWLRENLPETNHHYDVWHVSKGLVKKLEKLSNQAGCEDVRPWIRSISNHMCWCASSTPDGNQELMLAKWLSIGNHMQNIHEGHDSEVFPRCAHGEIDESVRKKKWLKPSTKATEKLIPMLENTRLQNDVKKLSPLHQTSNVEAYHSLIIHFCPKSTAYSYLGMLSRLILAALHYNENSDRPWARTKEGEEACTITFPKYKKKQGGYSIQKRKVPATYKYVTSMMTTLCEDVVLNPEKYSDVTEGIVIPPPLASQYTHPSKEEAVATYNKRFATPNTV